MNRKLVIGVTLSLTICLFILGTIFKMTADKQQGVAASSGIMLDGQYVETSSGRIGANREKYEAFNVGGTIFYILAGVTGVICIGAVATQKKSK